MNNKINDNPPPPRWLTHKLIAVCAVALVVAGSWAKPAGKQSPLIHLEQIDHYNSLTTTGLARYPADNPAVEFDRLVTPEIISAARIRNSPGTLRLKWSSLLLPAFSGYVKVHEARYRYLKIVSNGQNYYVDVPVSSDSTPIPVSIAPNSVSAPIEIPLGTLPNFVVGGELQLRIELRGNIGTQLPGEPDALAWGNKDVWNTFGTVYLTAQQPADIQGTPWVEVLEQACWYAQEKSSESEIRTQITYGVYSETGQYDPNTRNFTDLIIGSWDAVIDLKWYYQNGPSQLKMDCVDGASINVVLTESLGFDSALILYKSQTWPVEPIIMFTTASVRPARWHHPFWSFENLEFRFHCVAKAGNSVFDGVLLFEADLNGNVYWLPPTH